MLRGTYKKRAHNLASGRVSVRRTDRPGRQNRLVYTLVEDDAKFHHDLADFPVTSLLVPEIEARGLGTVGFGVRQDAPGKAVIEHLGQPVLTISTDKLAKPFGRKVIDGLYYFLTEQSEDVLRGMTPDRYENLGNLLRRARRVEVTPNGATIVTRGGRTLKLNLDGSLGKP